MDQEWEFTIWGDPIGKPRMTQRDKWRQRDCVMRYRAWADTARLSTSRLSLPTEPYAVYAVAYLPIPKSWSRLKMSIASGAPHRNKPDGDNILKSICDALFKRDEVIVDKRVRKFWDDGLGPRIEVHVYNYLPTLCPNTESSNDGETEAGEGATETAA